jgi:hypothetical protein
MVRSTCHTSEIEREKHTERIRRTGKVLIPDIVLMKVKIQAARKGQRDITGRDHAGDRSDLPAESLLI